jgi:membrane-associated protease RseP (regulator of RpoE activity)
VLVQTVAITSIGALWKPAVDENATPAVRVLITLTIVAFAISVIAAGTLLKSLPATAQRLPPPQGKNIFQMGTFEGEKGWRVSTLAGIQTWLFVIGWLSFVLAIVVNVWGS